MAGATVKILGLDETLASLNARISKIRGATIGGLLAGGLIIQREAQIRTPVRYGNLRASAYTRKAPDNPEAVEVGFTASYALYVHENLEAHHTVGEAKFLEHAVEAKKDEAVAAVASRAKGQEAADVGDEQR